MESTLDIASLKDLIRETMREVLNEERILLFKMLMPYVSNVKSWSTIEAASPDRSQGKLGYADAEVDGESDGCSVVTSEDLWDYES